MTEQVQRMQLEDVIGDRFGRYSKYVIQDRAIPDVRDGLKPVQRRILYAMYKEGNTYEKSFRKSAKTVGNVIGNYHPHGDSSVYEAMIRLSQEWKMREGLIDIHGNKGSVDGDPPAAMRYTEARLAEISNEMLRDINKNTVQFINNFDDTEMEPTVLPSKFPNLLVNGSTGISAGYATDIPPHNLGEVIDATLKVIDKPSTTVEELMEVVKGPDFPTGGIIQGVDQIRKAYETGRGKIIVRSKVRTEDTRGSKTLIIIDELPFEVNKANLVKKMDEIRADRNVDGILEVRDETDREGMRIVVEVKKEANVEGIINYFYKKTDLQVSYNFNMVAISDRAPKQLGLKEILTSYVAHQKAVIINRSRHELSEAERRMHIIEGLMKALSILDEVIRVIRDSDNKRNAKENLVETFSFTEAQAEAIVMLQLYRLTNTDIVELETEHNELDYTINQLREILSNEKQLLKVIKKELRDIRKKYATPRRSTVEDEIQTIELEKEVLIAKEEVVVSLTREGYVKRTSQRSYNASTPEEIGMKEDDQVLLAHQAHTLEHMLVFTSHGNYMIIPVHELPDIRWKDNGQHLSNRFRLGAKEVPVAAFVIEGYGDDISVVTTTRQGQIKKTELKAYEASRIRRPISGINLKKGDAVISVELAHSAADVLLVTERGISLRYPLSDVNATGLKAQGVRAIQLKADDTLVFSGLITNEKFLVTATQRGAVKRTAIDTFESAGRAQVGSTLLKEIKSKPHRIIGARLIENNIGMTLRSSGSSFDLDARSIRVSGKYANGSFVVDENEFGEVKSIIFGNMTPSDQ
ncbi:DNA topoisomerase IV subunit A [Salinicoccus hispanicus]|uniref:DNA topoisomerase 4 subunit A n=1 Tax=Salinicoccus hispanicus TaxID=157225 RepID=A0A6N8TXB8_9STAP|nr:DNA topoisomerase IV subunit A [Salinicoccus hispanicus]MXQ50360.1 DNA topoisomerase IV subunit A [Salinicoccus hispanicus]